MTGHHKPQPHLASGTRARSRRLYLAAQTGGKKNCTSLPSVTASYSNTMRKRLSYIRKGHRVFSSLFKANRVGKRFLAETLSTALSIPHLSFLTPSILQCPHLQPYKLSRKERQTPKDPPKFNTTHFLQHARAAPRRKRYNPPTPPCTTEQPRAKLCNLRLFYQTLAGSGRGRGGNFKTQSRHGPQTPAIAPRLPPAAPKPRAEPSQAARPRGRRPSSTPYPHRHGAPPPAPLGTTVTLQPTVKLNYEKPRGVSNPPPNLPALRSSSSLPLRLSLTSRCLQGAERRGHPRRLPGGGSVPPLLFALPSAAAPPPARLGSVWLSTARLGWAQHGRDGGRGGARPERGAELEILKCTAAGRPWSTLLLIIINNNHF